MAGNLVEWWKPHEIRKCVAEDWSGCVPSRSKEVGCDATKDRCVPVDRQVEWRSRMVSEAQGMDSKIEEASAFAMPELTRGGDAAKNCVG